MNSNLGYIIGVLVGDGTLNENSIVLNTKDKDFALVFNRALENEFKLKTKLHFYNGLWRAMLNSRKVVKLLKNIDYKLIARGTIETKSAFLKGFYDSEGSAYYQEKIGVRNRKIELVNTDLELLTFCKNLLDELGIKTLKIDKRVRDIRVLKGRTLPIMVYARFLLRENKENFIRFNNLIGFSIERKQEILNKMISSYIFSERNKWIAFRQNVISDSKTKRYTELRKEFDFIPKSVIDHWIYPKTHNRQNV